MIKKLLLVLVPVIAVTLLTSEQMSDNGKAAKTGAPGEVDCTDCHSDFGINSGGGSISITATGMPTHEYTPGQTYNMSVTVARSANSLFGVGIEALTASNANGGTLNITDATHTQIKSATVSGVSRRNVVHTLDGGANPSSMTFNFSWTAPAAGTGPVTFYFAGVAADGDGNESNDYVYKSNQVFTEATCTTPAQPGSISGGATQCSGSAVTYSVATVSGATSYTWTLPSGWTGSSTSNSINVTSGSTSGNVTVTANNACGSSTAQTLAVTANTTPAQPGTISGGATPCSGSSVTYSVAAVSGATTYTWTLPSGWTGTSTSNSINVTTGSTSGNISVTANNSCGNSTARTLAVTASAMPSQPGSISGSTSLCSGTATTYSVATVAGATTYAWTLPSGWTGTSTTNSINVTSSTTSGNITVTANNSCGSSTPSTLAVTAGTMSVNSSSTSPACNGGTDGSATVTVSGGTGPYTYQWSNGNTTASVSGVAAGSYSVTVTDQTGCVNNLSVSITEPSAIVADAGANAAVCSGAAATIGGSPTGLGGTGTLAYLWSPATGLSSATDPNPVATPASATGYTVVVTDANGCSSSATVQVDIDATPAPVITMSGDTLYTSGGVTYEWYLNGNLAGSGASPFFVATQSGNYEVVAYSAAGCAGVSPVFAFTPTGIYSSALLAGINVFPNPARDEFQITLPAGSGSVVARLMDLTGKEVLLTTIDEQHRTVDVRMLQSGVYFLTLELNGQRAMSRLVVE